jgi:hypothetical protein
MPEIPMITFEPASIGRNPKVIARVAQAKGSEVDDLEPWNRLYNTIAEAAHPHRGCFPTSLR